MSFRASTSAYLPDTGQVVTLTVPAGVVSTDVGLIAAGITDNTGPTCTVTSSAGAVTMISAMARPGTQNQGCGVWAITGVTAGATITLTFSKAVFATVGAAWWSDTLGVDVAGSLGARSSSSTTVTAPSVTTSAAGETVVGVFIERTASPGPSTSVSLSAGAQELFVPGEASPACTNSVTFADFTQPAAGATAGLTATYPAASGNAVGIQIALTPSNAAPTANAGPDQSDVAAGATFTLDGSGSSDPDGTIASYTWTQTAGDPVTLSDSTAQKPTGTAPSTSSPQTLTFQLVTTDNDGATSTPDTVNIGVLAAPSTNLKLRVDGALVSAVEKIRVAGVWVPLIEQIVSGASSDTSVFTDTYVDTY
jgi:hypothetical protein